MNFNSSFLLASLFWGSIGLGYFIYGKKQQAIFPMMGGIMMILVSYVVSSWLLMSAIGAGLMIGVYLLAARGH